MQGRGPTASGDHRDIRLDRDQRIAQLQGRLVEAGKWMRSNA
jgi:hypothetical protein